MLASFKVHLCVIVLSVTVCTVGYICLFIVRHVQAERGSRDRERATGRHVKE